MAMLNRNVVGVALIVTLLVLLSGCATNGMSRLEREQAYDEFIVTEKLESLNRITAFRYSGWTDLRSDRHLILNVGVNRYYLLALRNSCFDLDHSLTIKVNNTGSSLQARFDSISVAGNRHQKCFIDRIYKITKEQRKALNGLHKSDPDDADSEAKTEAKTDQPKTA